ncbi:MAG: hypothetical protein JO057_09080 [Chloroflexi bacterium]|nr:hypothetical protein [Chloroflexota bacterium]
MTWCWLGRLAGSSAAVAHWHSLALLAGLCLVASVLACRAPAATPTPVVPRSTPTAAATPVPTVDAQTSDMQNAFVTNVNDLTSDVEGLANAECGDLTAEMQANPTEVTEIHGFAAALQRAGSQQPALSTSGDVQSSLSDLSKALAQLDSALTTCGIKNP